MWIDTEPGAAAEVLGYLHKMQFLKRVEPADVSTDWAVLSLVGPATADRARRWPGCRSRTPPAARCALDGGGFVAAHGLAGRGRGRPARAARAQPTVFDALVGGRRRTRPGCGRSRRCGSRPAGPGSASRPITARSRTRSAGSARAVHLDKGCYRGQETVARVQNLGRPPRRLVLLHLAGESDELPEPGTPVETGGRAVGFLGTAVHHYELGPIALAVIKRSIEAGASRPDRRPHRASSTDVHRPVPA